MAGKLDPSWPEHGLSALGEREEETVKAIGCWILVCAGVLLPDASSAQFVNIVDTTGSFRSFAGTLPSMNNAGEVVFRASLDDGRDGVFVGNVTLGSMQTPVLVADDAGPFLILDRPGIGDDGTILFWASLDGGGEGIFSGPDPVADLRLNDSGDFGELAPSTNFAINGSGATALRASVPGGEAVLRIPASGPPLEVARSPDDFFGFFAGSPPINDSGTVLFGAFPGVENALFTGSDPVADRVLDNTGGFDTFSALDLNELGEFVMRAALDDGTQGIFRGDLTTGSDPVADAIATAPGSFDGFPASNNNHPDINDSGMVAFLAFLASLVPVGLGTGIFVGPDPVADKVIAAGDPLFGSTVEGVNFTRGGLNDEGEIAFTYSLENGVSGVAVFVPEPTGSASLATAMAALLMLAGRRRRRALLEKMSTPV